MPYISKANAAVQYTLNRLVRRRYVPKCCHDSLLFCALSPHFCTLRNWSKAWPILTCLPKWFGVAVSSSVRNYIVPRGHVWDKTATKHGSTASPVLCEGNQLALRQSQECKNCFHAMTSGCFSSQTGPRWFSWPFSIYILITFSFVFTHLFHSDPPIWLTVKRIWQSLGRSEAWVIAVACVNIDPNSDARSPQCLVNESLAHPRTPVRNLQYQSYIEAWLNDRHFRHQILKHIFLKDLFFILTLF